MARPAACSPAAVARLGLAARSTLESSSEKAVLGESVQAGPQKEGFLLRHRVVLGFVLVLSAPGTILAQNFRSFHLRDLLPNFFTNSTALDPSISGGVNHSMDFNGSSGPESPDATLALRAFNQQLANQLSSSPFPSPSGGFTYQFEPGLGFTRTNESFGPIYADRADTIGKGRLNLGVDYSHSSFERIDGLRLQDGDLQLVVRNRDVNGDGELFHPYYEGDLLFAKVLLKVNTDVTAFVFTYGLSDRIDVGAVIPVAQVRLDIGMQATIVRLATGFTAPTIPRFPSGTPILFDNGILTTATFQTSGSASGLGDIAVRAKFLALRSSTARLAIAADVWFPSGNERDLLGTGATRVKGSLIGSLRLDRFSPHVNAGYTWASTPPNDQLDQSGSPPRIPDEISYTAGFDLALGPRVTFAADLLGRTLRRAQILGTLNRTYQANTNPDDKAPPMIAQTTLPSLAAREGDVHTLLGSAGVKINPLGNLLVTVNALFALDRRHGLQSSVTPFLGIDYSF